ncbi:MAG TPA: hypothetical protein EYP14_04520, partial [Planctomycetaceae bacterium]|nr:hypothetical protein [Planctomycetaceae bacterium]
MRDRYLVVFDTPSIKQYVFGTDPLREIRGASANLDRLNRELTRRELREALQGAQIDEVYANGGSAQFVINNVEEGEVRRACERVVARFMRDTAGDVRPVYGVARLGNDQSYSVAVAKAHFELRSRREMSGIVRVPALVPIMAECSSASHLPATGLYSIAGDEPRALSESSRVKEQRGRFAKEHGIWAEWMEHLAKSGRWPVEDDWDRLRCDTSEEIGERASGHLEGYIGLVYADGNAMGRIVRQFDSPAVCRAFSKIVDGSIRQACFEALEQVCQPEIASVREPAGGSLRSLPADILLLGGDDLLVMLPADRALEFAAEAARRFQERTEQEIAHIDDPAVSRFFKRLGVSRMTISCGVALARSRFPFYLLLDLAEDLLKNAKRGGPGGRSDEPRIDFHIVAGASSFSLKQTRTQDYYVEKHNSSADPKWPRTLRPLALSQMDQLRTSVQRLRAVNFPRSKLHALHEASLLPSFVQAQRTIRDIFGRCRALPSRNERRALWQAIQHLCPDGWTCNAGTF